MSKSVRKQEILAIADKIPAIANQVMELANVATSGEPVSPVAMQLLSLEISILKNFFEEFEVQDGELIDVTESVNMGQEIAQRFQEMQAALQDLQAQNEALQAQLVNLGAPPPGAPDAGAGAPTQAPVGPGV